MNAPRWTDRLRQARALPNWADNTFAARLSPPRRRALASTVAYVVLALLWIMCTDWLVTALASSRAQVEALQAAKGVAFVLGSAVFGYLVLARPLVQLSDAEQRWRHVMHALDDVTWLASPDGAHLLYLNEAAEAVYGRKPAEFLADPRLWLNAVHPEDRSAVESSSAAIRAGDVRSMEYRIVRPDGRVRWLRDRASMIRDAGGKPIALGGVSSDITEQRQARDQELEAHQLLDGIVESAMDAIISVDGQHIVRVFNRAAGEVFGLPPELALGQALDQFIPVDRRAVHRAHMAVFADHGITTRRMGRLSNLFAVRADGTQFPIEASISRFGEGDRIRMTVILRDLSDMRRAEQANRERAMAEAANQAKSQFLARMSHELRTPLNAVLGFSQLLLSDQGEPLAQRQTARVEHIRVAGWHLLGLINDVLDLSRVESNQLVVESTTVSLAEVIGEARAFCETLANQQRVSIVVRPWEGATILVRADALRLRQVLVNLLSNAIKYNRPGGTAEIRLGLDNGRAQVQVCDTGVGMSAEQLQHLYEPFNRLGRERSAIEGTGIGLVLARQLMGMMDGDLQVTSVPGQGTTVTVTLQHDASAVGSAGWPYEDFGAGASDAQLPKSATADPRGIVLYIEDNPVNVILVEQALARWPGIRFISAEDGATGIGLARVVQPDLVLLDMLLPDMRGTAVLRALRQEPSLAQVPVVVLSAGSSAQDVAEACQAGAHDYWTKPLDFRKFESGVLALLQGRPPRDSSSATIAP